MSALQAQETGEPVECPLAGRIGDKVFRLRILATSDLHVHITPWDYHHDRSSAALGLARTATLINQARAEVACSILLDNGDFLQGSPMGDAEVLRGLADPTRPHPMIAAMNALGYDAVTLGNHEFSNGLDFLMRSLAQAQFPVISANMLRHRGASPAEDQPLLAQRLLLQRQVVNGAGQALPIRIGIIGMAPPQTALWDMQQLAGAIQTRDIVEAAAAHVPLLRAEGADIVIALSHSGIGDIFARDDMENATAALASVPGIDALVAGHTHQTFPAPDFPAGPQIDPMRGRLWGKPAVMPGFHGSHLGVIDLYLCHDAETGWTVLDSECALRPIATRDATGQLAALTRSAPEIMAVAVGAHGATRQWSRRKIGQTSHALHSYFAPFAPSAAVRLVARAQAAHVARVLQGGPYAGLPVLSAAAPFRAGGRSGPENYTFIAPGDMNLRHAADLYPHPNTIAALLVTGADLHLWLERSFSQFHQIAAGATDVELIDADSASFNFDTIEGLTWQVDLAQPPRHDQRGAVIHADSRRIRDLRHDGRPLDPGAQFVLATNSYRAGGSGGFSAAGIDRLVLNGPHSSRDVLLDYLRDAGPVPPPEPPNWRFRPQPGSTVTVDTAPDAAAHLGDLAPQRLDDLGLIASGFRRFRLYL